MAVRRIVPCPSTPPPSVARSISRLSRSPTTRCPHLQGELNAILAFVEQLSEVDVKGVEPMTSVTPMQMKKRALDVVLAGLGQLVAVDREDIVGWVAGGPAHEVDLGPAAYEVRACYVDPDRWRTGVGRRLR